MAIRKHEPLRMSLDTLPRVLLLGSGVLQLGGGGNWKALLESIAEKTYSTTNLSGIPYAMQPEALCGTDVEQVQQLTAQKISSSPIHPLLRELLSLDFDAILTTNYTYEIEQVLSGGTWSSNQRKAAFCALDGHSHAHFNTCICNLIQRENKKPIPVFHIHGEKERSKSLILSYYSYARSVSNLIEYNSNRANQYREHQENHESLEVQSWLDYFLMGDVYTVGFALDPSEFDIWWAIERKSREKAQHGKLHAYLTPKADEIAPQKVLLPAMQADCTCFNIVNDYEPAYRQIVDMITEQMTTKNDT